MRSSFPSLCVVALSVALALACTPGAGDASAAGGGSSGSTGGTNAGGAPIADGTGGGPWSVPGGGGAATAANGGASLATPGNGGSSAPGNGGSSAPGGGGASSSTPGQGGAAGGTGDAPVDAALPAGPFACTRILGIKQTGEWFSAGFETQVDNARWEVVPVHNGHIELWADNKNGIWAQKPESPCTGGAAPERIVFVGTNYDYVTVDEWQPKLEAVVANIVARFPAAKRIELMAHVHAPDNVACPGNLDYKTHIKPGQLEAMARVAAAHADRVVVAPRFTVRSCADFGLYPHFKGDGARAVASAIAAHYR